MNGSQLDDEVLDAPDDPKITTALRDRDVEEHVRRIVNAAPPLSATQRDRLAVLLRSTAGGAAA